MRLPVNDFDKWYSAQGFGAKTTYGYHEGEDLNLKTGGDTDLGQPLICIANGEVTSVHNHTSSPTFGKHIHIKHVGPWGEVYSHYAHCRDIYPKTGDKVSEGQVIATVGKSGTGFAHLHFAIKLQPTGIDGIAKTQEDLKKWTNPLEFIKKWQVQEDTMPDYLKTLLQENNLQNEGDVRAFFEKGKRYDEDVKSFKARLVTAEETISSKSLELANEITKNDALQGTVDELQEKINSIRSERDKAAWEKERMEIELEAKIEELIRAKQKIEELEGKTPLMGYSFWKRLASLFKLPRG